MSQNVPLALVEGLRRQLPLGVPGAAVARVNPSPPVTLWVELAPGSLAGGWLGHPLAQRVGLMAVASGDTGQHAEDTGHVSAPDNDDDDDFWS